MCFHRALLMLGLGLSLATFGTGGCAKKKAKTAGCAKDTDCKGNRICEKGQCVDPSATGDPAVSPAARRAVSGKPGQAQAGTPSRPGPGGQPGAPGVGPARPGSPGTPGAPGVAGVPNIRVCVGSKCVSMGAGFGHRSADMGKLFQLFSQLMMDSLAGGGRPGAKAPKLKVCVGPKCVVLDDQLRKDPSALFRLLTPLAPALLQKLFQGGLGRSGGLGRGFPFGPRPGRRGRRGGGPGPGPKATPPAAGAGSALLKDYAGVAQLGPRAVGREVLLSGLGVTSVSDERLVLEGPGQEMIVLRIPAAHRDLVPALRLATGKITVRFRVLSPPIGKILHGELLALK